MNQNISVDMTPGLFQPTLYYSQGDVGREFSINIVSRFGEEMPSGVTATIEATKPSGLGFSLLGTLTDNVASFVATDEMTDEWGRFPAQLRISDGNGVVIFSANFVMDGKKNAHPDGTIDGKQGSLIPELTVLVERIEAATEQETVYHEAEAWAVGQRAGEDVDEDDATYHNNSKYYKEQAEISRDAAASSQAAAATSETNAAGYKDAAAGSATAAAESAVLASNAATAAAQVFSAAGDYSFSLDEDGDLWLNITISE